MALAETKIFDHLRVEGAIFLRAEYTESWAYTSLEGPATAAALRPGARRVTTFHVVANGECWVALPGRERQWASSGDVIVLPYADQHTMGGVEPAEPVSITQFWVSPPWNEFIRLSHGAGGPRTDIVCGYIHCADPLFDPELRALPPLLVVHPDEAAAQWVRASIDYAMTAPSSVATQLPALLLGEVLRIHLESAPAVNRGWLGALRDPVLAPALGRLHAEPERRWTVADLAAEVAVSRSLLDSRFREVLGRSPIRYLADWRMHVADDLLRTTDLNVSAVARKVGYDSEEAFSRAFKRARGEAPSTWRTHRRTRR
jgi:AraC-like DNA-binding protein